MRHRPALIGLACLFALAQASANEVTSVPQSSAKPHSTKAKTSKTTPLTAASLGEISFSDPYGPPIGAGKAKSAHFAAPERTLPVDTQDTGFSIRAGRDSPDSPMSGGLKFRF